MALHPTFGDIKANTSFTPVQMQIFDSLHPELQYIIDEVAKYIDIALLEGYRGPEKQDLLFSKGRTRRKFPNSPHNTLPARAVDLLPYPVNRENTIQIVYLAGHIKMTARAFGINLLWGGDMKETFLASGEIKRINYVHHYELT